VVPFEGRKGATLGKMGFYRDLPETPGQIGRKLLEEMLQKFRAGFFLSVVGSLLGFIEFAFAGL